MPALYARRLLEMHRAVEAPQPVTVRPLMSPLLMPAWVVETALEMVSLQEESV